ncbi:MAG: RNA polymerase sigma factor [Thermomicrobiales bacterium]
MAASIQSASNLADHQSPDLAATGEAVTGDDRLTFAATYREFAPHIYRYCFRCLGNREDAEDATSQVFTQALAGFHRLRDGNVRPWLYRIAHNVVIDMIRKRRPASSIDGVRGDSSAITGVDAEFERQELRAELDEALASLSERDRQLVLLRLAGLTGEEIATVLRCSHGAVRVAHHRALDRLRVILFAQGNIDAEISH